jgi:hypothetical protein
VRLAVIFHVGATYRFDVEHSEASAVQPVLFRRTELKVQHDPDDYTTKQAGGVLTGS